MTSALRPRPHYAVPVLILKSGQYTAVCSSCSITYPMRETEAEAQADCDAHESAARYGRAG